MRTLVPTLLALLLLIPQTVRANEDAWAQAQALQLWTDAEWLTLGHYKPGTWPGSWRSHA
jgi:Tfp pilus assembly protein PilV